MDRNRLHGKQGDEINALLAACGFNLRKLGRVFLLPIFWTAEWLFDRRFAAAARPRLQLAAAPLAV